MEFPMLLFDESGKLQPIWDNPDDKKYSLQWPVIHRMSLQMFFDPDTAYENHFTLNR